MFKVETNEFSTNQSWNQTRRAPHFCVSNTKTKPIQAPCYRIRIKHFTTNQIFEDIQGILKIRVFVSVGANFPLHDLLTLLTTSTDLHAVDVADVTALYDGSEGSEAFRSSWALGAFDGSLCDKWSERASEVKSMVRIVHIVVAVVAKYLWPRNVSDQGVDSWLKGVIKKVTKEFEMPLWSFKESLLIT